MESYSNKNIEYCVPIFSMTDSGWMVSSIERMNDKQLKP